MTIQAFDLVRSNDIASDRVSAKALCDGASQVPAESHGRSVKLDEAHLEKKRIAANRASRESRSFDVLRTQLLQEMDKNGWQFLAVTSPTPACGKSTIACNLALSIARLADRAVVLVDLDLASPAVARLLGVNCDKAVTDVLQGQAFLSETLISATVVTSSLLLLPGKGHVSHSSDLLASNSMNNMLQTLRREFRDHIVIFDLPSVLKGDDVISVLPKMDAVLLVTSAGKSKIEDVHTSKRYLAQTPVLRVVVNKVTRANMQEIGY